MTETKQNLLGKRLQVVREGLGLSQVGFAQKLGMNQGTYQNLESGKTTRIKAEALSILAGMGVDIVGLVGGQPAQPTTRGEDPLSRGPASQHDKSDVEEAGPIAVTAGQSSPAFQEAEVLGQELSAWLKRQAIRRPGQWPGLVKTVENMRSTWESEQASRESPDDAATAGPAGQVAARGDH